VAVNSNVDASLADELRQPLADIGQNTSRTSMLTLERSSAILVSHKACPATGFSITLLAVGTPFKKVTGRIATACAGGTSSAR